jgi:hypothetical protein
MEPPTSPTSPYTAPQIDVEPYNFFQQEDEPEQNKSSSKNSTTASSVSPPLSPWQSTLKANAEQDKSIVYSPTDSTTASSHVSPLQPTTKTNAGAAAPPSAPPTARSHSMSPVSSPSKEQSKSRSSLQPSPNTAHVTKSSFLTRKAHKFSSLKKKKGASTLINKLFCNTGMPVAACSSTKAQKTAPKTPSLADQTSPQTSADNSPILAAESAEVDNNVGCVSLSRALEQATESLTLEAESTVRSTIQGSINDAFKEAAETHMPSTIQGSLTEAFTEVIKDIANYDKKKTMTKLVGACQSPLAAPKKTMKTPGGINIATPAGGRGSLFPSTMLNESPLFRNKRDAISSSSNENNDVGGPTPLSFIKFASTPMSSSDPASVVMALSDEPTTGSHRTAKTKNSSSGYLSRFMEGRTGTTPNTTPLKKEVTASESSQIDVEEDNSLKEPRKNMRAAVVDKDDDDDDDDDAFLPDDFKLDSTVTVEKEQSEQREQPEASEPAPTIAASTITTTPAKSPVREMGKRYTWSEMDRRIADAVEVAKDEWKKIMGEEVKAHVAEAQEQQLDMALKESKSEAEVLLQEHSEQWKQEHGAELKQIKSKHDRKINEFKDQAALANRLTKTRDAEFEALEAELETLRQEAADASQTKVDVPSESELKELQTEQAKELKSLTNELAAVKVRLIASEKEASDTKAKLSTKEKEATNVKARLSFAEKEMQMAKSKQTSTEKEATEARSKLSLKEMGTTNTDTRVSLLEQEVVELKTKLAQTETEVAQTGAQLAMKEKEATDLKAKLLVEQKSAADVRSKLANQETEAAEQEMEAAEIKDQEATASEAKLTSQEKKLASLNSKLAAKDNEVTLLKEKLASKTEALKSMSLRTRTSTSSMSPSRVVKTISSPGRSPAFKSPGRTGSATKNPSSNSKPRRESEPIENNIELHEREKESLRAQIATLEEQLAKSSSEHERALQQLRHASETELFQVKKDMEQRLEHHMAKERELQETLSEVSSRGKEELLEEIELLQAEKKADRNGGLREVQKKEDLLKRIASLEKMEKDLVIDHERSLQDVRYKSEGDIKRLKKELEEQRNERLAKERELLLAISETGSFEKEELLTKVEKLESKLEGERNGAVLIKMKIAVLEKELKAEEKKHGEEMEAFRTTTDAEVSRLQLELDGLCAAQEKALVVSKERDSLLERMQELREEIEQERSEQKHKRDEICKQHMEEVDSINLKGEERVEKIRVELKKKAAEVIQEFEIVTKQSTTEEKNLREHVELLEAEVTTNKEEYERKLQQITKDHKLQLDELEADGATTSKAEYERKLELVSTDHRMQLDELLAQLDLVEAEHKQKISETEKVTNEKDTVIADLGAQLADAHAREQEVDATHKKLAVNLARVEEEAAQAKEDVEDLKKKLEKSKAASDKFMAGEAERRERACDEAREEMIERAELQFKAANDLYVKLKREYDSSIGKVERLESELKSVKAKLEKAKNEKEDALADLKVEVAELKAANASTESDAASRAKDYRREMEGLLKAANDFENKVKDAESTSRSLERSLSAVAAAKTKLQQEYDEMKNVCEELMVMVEGQPQQRHEC